MSVLDFIVSLVAPHECLSCNAEGWLLCSECQLKLSNTPSTCYRCALPTVNHQTCKQCQETTGLDAVRTISGYEGAAKDLVWRLKFTGARQAAQIMADLMAPHQIDLNGALIVPIPTATQRVRQRGYDQSYLIARAFSRKTTAQFTPVLRRLGQQRQRGASKSTRAIQLSDAYWLRHYNFKNRHVVLVDDVVTTGATLESAARLLRAAGATRVEAIIFAKA